MSSGGVRGVSSETSHSGSFATFHVEFPACWGCSLKPHSDGGSLSAARASQAAAPFSLQQRGDGCWSSSTSQRVLGVPTETPTGLASEDLPTLPSSLPSSRSQCVAGVPTETPCVAAGSEAILLDDLLPAMCAEELREYVGILQELAGPQASESLRVARQRLQHWQLAAPAFPGPCFPDQDPAEDLIDELGVEEEALGYSVPVSNGETIVDDGFCSASS